MGLQPLYIKALAVILLFALYFGGITPRTRCAKNATYNFSQHKGIFHVFE